MTGYYLSNYWRLVGDAGTFHHFVGIEDEGLGVAAVLKGHSSLAEHGLVTLTNGAEVGEEYIIAVGLCKEGCAYAAFASTEYN